MTSPITQIKSIPECTAQISSRKKNQAFPVYTHDVEDVLCKIAFDIDSKQEQLLIRQDTTLDEIADQLIFRIGKSNIIQNNEQQEITNEQKILLKQEIKTKIENIIEQNTDKTQQAIIWKNKLNYIVSGNLPQRTPIDSLLPSSTRMKRPQQKSTKSVTYFGYRPFYSQSFEQQQNSSLKNKQNYQKIKKIHRQFVEPRSQLPLDSGKSRLYDLGKSNEVHKNYLSKMQQWFSVQKQLSECTFHPHIRRTNGNDIEQSSAKNRSNQNVFNRLYHQAQDKQEKMKKIQKQLSQREEQEFTHLNFIPTIDQCSKQIVKVKKQSSLAKENNIYQNLYQQNHNKRKIFQKPSEWTFHPKLCPQSKIIVKKLEIIEPRNKLYQKKINSKGKSKDKQKKQKIFFDNNNERQRSTENSYRNSSYKLVSKDINPKTTKNKYLTEKSLNISEPEIRQDKSVSFRMANQISTTKKSKNIIINSCESQPFLKKTLPTAHFQNQIRKQQKKEKDFTSKNEKEKAFKKKKINNVNKQQKDQSNRLNIKSQKYTIQDDTEVTDQQQEKYKWIITQNTISKTEVSDVSIEHKQKKLKKLKNPFQFFEMQQKSRMNIKDQQNNPFFKKNVLKETSHIDSLFQQRKNLIFESIFDFLKTKSSIESEINYQSILNNALIPQNLQILLYPMAQEMRQLNVGLDKEEFIWSIGRIFQNISLQERGLLLAWGLKLQPESIKNIR